MKEDLPQKLKEYLQFLSECISERGFQPSDREAARALHKDKSTITSYKNQLEEMGLIRRIGHRGIEILDNNYFSKLGYTRVSKSIIKGGNPPSAKQSVKVKNTKKSRSKQISKDAILARVLLTLHQTWDKLGVIGMAEMIPVQVEFILKEEGYSLKKDSLQTNISGLLVVEEKVVVVNSQESEQRQRFTIAHEIGHLKLHKNRQKIDDIVCNLNNFQKETLRQEEGEADYFAVNLLVPLDKLKEFLHSLNISKEEGISLENLTKVVSEKFNVSLTVAKSRLEKINIYNSYR